MLRRCYVRPLSPDANHEGQQEQKAIADRRIDPASTVFLAQIAVIFGLAQIARYTAGFTGRVRSSQGCLCGA